MAMQGNLRDMAVADLIQHNCQDRKTSQLQVEHNDQRATLYFDQGEVSHATLGSLQGEEVIYQILDWKEGLFSLEIGVPPPAVTIHRGWSSLLLAGAQRLDEEHHSTIHTQEKTPMASKKKSELLAEALSELIANSADIEGAAVVGTDGLVYSINVPTGKVDDNLVGAVAAAALGLSKRSVEQLKRGVYNQTLVQGDKGNIIISQLDSQTLFVGLTPPNINLGMAFAETRSATGRLREILS